MRRLLAVSSALVVLALAPTSPTQAEVGVGMVLSTQARDGVAVREAARPLARATARLPYATRVRVEELSGPYARVVADAGVTGWVKGSELVPPSALTGSGNEPTPSSSPADVLAAGRQFDQKTEKFARSVDAGVNASYPLVDQVERTKPTDAELFEFIRGGALGGTATMAEIGAHFAKVTLVGAIDSPEAVTLYDEPPVADRPALTEEDFVRRLGVGFSPEQEYWLGRAVAAAAIAEHGLDKDERNQALVRKVGASLAALCSRVRATHGGWHFAVLDDATPNAISGPGGFVLVTRGALELARNEDEVAGVIAHEMAHVSSKHGEAMVRKSREFQEELAKLQRVVAQPQHGADACKICWEVARTLKSTAKTLVTTLDKEGYGKDLELEADWAGSLFLCEAGYRASAIAEYLELLPSREHATWTTHPSSDDRIDALRPLVLKHSCPFDADTGAQIRLPRWKELAVRPAPAAPSPASERPGEPAR